MNIQIGQQFRKYNQIFTVAFLKPVLTQVNEQLCYNVSIRLDAEHTSKYFNFTSPTEEVEAFCLNGFEYVGRKADCGCVYTEDEEIEIPCVEHVARVLSAVEELEVEAMFAGV